jgi:hypothetical protein
MSKSVIVIDDDEDTVRLFSEFLEENGINVIGNGFDGISAVKLFKETKPDVVLIDLNMPNGTGFYAIKKIQEIDKITPIPSLPENLHGIVEFDNDSVPLINLKHIFNFKKTNKNRWRFNRILCQIRRRFRRFRKRFNSTR